MAAPDYALVDQFRANLLRHRRQSGLSQEELALRASLHRTEIGLLERGHRLPRIDTLIKLAGATEVRPEALLLGIEWLPGQRPAGGAFRVDPPSKIAAARRRGRR
jgi:transcriptional regulator with XRE-family HTH domain